MLWDVASVNVAAGLDFLRDLWRYVLGPVLEGIEGDHPNRITEILPIRVLAGGPVFLAARLAFAFFAGDNFFDFLSVFLRGLAFFQGGRFAM